VKAIILIFCFWKSHITVTVKIATQMKSIHYVISPYDSEGCFSPYEVFYHCLVEGSGQALKASVKQHLRFSSALAA
jgi:hypothetical protein